jgi:hypothetical protein
MPADSMLISMYVRNIKHTFGHELVCYVAALDEARLATY